jgi:hypothetical protein
VAVQQHDTKTRRPLVHGRKGPSAAVHGRCAFDRRRVGFSEDRRRRHDPLQNAQLMHSTRVSKPPLRRCRPQCGWNCNERDGDQHHDVSIRISRNRHLINYSVISMVYKNRSPTQRISGNAGLSSQRFGGMKKGTSEGAMEAIWWVGPGRWFESYAMYAFAVWGSAPASPRTISSRKALRLRLGAAPRQGVTGAHSRVGAGGCPDRPAADVARI